jgi:hypothetical protein
MIKIANINVCTPAIVYFVIAIVMLLVGYLLKLNVMSIGEVFSQFLCIIVCTLLLMGLCSVTPTASWIITGIFIFLTVTGLLSMLMGWVKNE